MRYNVLYLWKRIGFALVTFFAAITLNFLLPRLVGGDPADFLASSRGLGSPESVMALKVQFGLDNPSMLYQYKQYLIQLFHGNLGISYVNYPTPVLDIVKQALPWTLGIVLTATLISYLIGWLIGVKGAWKAGSTFDNSTLFGSFFLNSIPYFWVAIVVILIFSFKLDWFPIGRAMAPAHDTFSTWGKAKDIMHHAVLPVFTLMLASLASHILVLRNNLMRVLSEDYMLLAKAKGVSVSRRKYMYGARNALLPSFTGLMSSLGHVLGGTLTAEIVFSYPGVGMVTMNAVLNHDFPLIQGIFLCIAVSVIFFNLLADLIYPLIDPRVTLE